MQSSDQTDLVLAEENAETANEANNDYQTGCKKQISSIDQLKDWDGRMSTSFWKLFCWSNVILGILEYNFSLPIWHDQLPGAPWLGAVGMLLSGAVIAHFFSKTFSGNVFRWELLLMQEAEPSYNIGKLRQRLGNTRSRHLVYGSIILIVCSVYIYYLSLLRVTKEAAFIDGRVWEVSDWLPLLLFNINSIWIGIYWHFALKRAGLIWRIRQYKSQLFQLKETEYHHRHLAIKYWRKANSDGDLIPSQQLLAVIERHMDRDSTSPDFYSQPIPYRDCEYLILVTDQANKPVSGERFIPITREGYIGKIFQTDQAGASPLQLRIKQTDYLERLESVNSKRVFAGIQPNDKIIRINIDRLNAPLISPLLED